MKQLLFAVNIEYPSMQKEYKKKHDLHLKELFLLFNHKSLIQSISHKKYKILHVLYNHVQTSTDLNSTCISIFHNQTTLNADCRVDENREAIV